MAAISLSVSTVKPLGDRVFVKVSAAEEQTAGGIILPDAAKEKPQVGEITAVGPGKRGDDGSRQALDVKEGDKVLYSKYAGTDVKLGGEEYVLLSEKRYFGDRQLDKRNIILRFVLPIQLGNFILSNFAVTPLSLRLSFHG